MPIAHFNGLIIPNDKLSLITEKKYQKSIGYFLAGEDKRTQGCLKKETPHFKGYDIYVLKPSLESRLLLAPIKCPNKHYVLVEVLDKHEYPKSVLQNKEKHQSMVIQLKEITENFIVEGNCLIDKRTNSQSNQYELRLNTSNQATKTNLSPSSQATSDKKNPSYKKPFAKNSSDIKKIFPKTSLHKTPESASYLPAETAASSSSPNQSIESPKHFYAKRRHSFFSTSNKTPTKEPVASIDANKRSPYLTIFFILLIISVPTLAIIFAFYMQNNTKHPSNKNNLWSNDMPELSQITKNKTSQFKQKFFNEQDVQLCYGLVGRDEYGSLTRLQPQTRKDDTDDTDNRCARDAENNGLKIEYSLIKMITEIRQQIEKHPRLNKKECQIMGTSDKNILIQDYINQFVTQALLHKAVLKTKITTCNQISLIFAYSWLKDKETNQQPMATITFSDKHHSSHRAILFFEKGHSPTKSSITSLTRLAKQYKKAMLSDLCNNLTSSLDMIDDLQTIQTSLSLQQPIAKYVQRLYVSGEVTLNMLINPPLDHPCFDELTDLLESADYTLVKNDRQRPDSAMRLA